jgi:lipid-binding SYLF domain-containing protein
MRKVISAVSAVAIGAVLGTVALSALSTGETKRLNDAATVLREIHAVPDKDVPQDLWNKAACVAVIPGLKKAAFVVGGEYGKGLMSCRHAGAWSSPVFMELEKGSWGLQIGAQSIDLVLLIMNEHGVDKLLGNKVTLGADASVAAGPVGRNAAAATDAQLKAEILSYSRTQGLFAGVDLSGGVLHPDKDDNADLYGAGVSAHDVLVAGTVETPEVARAFVHALDRNGTVGTSGR